MLGRGKKEILSDFLATFRIFDLLKRHDAKALFVVNYHRLCADTFSTAFDNEVFEFTVEEFSRQLQWLKENFNVVNENEVVEMSLSRKIPQRSVLITFDDGYIDNYTLAFPLLKSYGLPAIFFIPTESIIKRQLGWWDIISYLIKQSSKKELFVGNEKFNLLERNQKKAAIRTAINIFKTTMYESYKDFIATLSVDCDVEIPDHNLQSGQLMTWEHINELKRNNIAIGSHTHSHRVLSTLSEPEQLSELTSSKDLLEKHLESKVQSISYPVGNYEHFSLATKKMAKAAGYKIGFSYNTGYNKDLIDRFDIKRFSFAHHSNVMKGQFYLPSLFC